jgi:hypothetical protein
MNQQEKVVNKKRIRDLSYLKPKDTIQINGKLSYKESLGSWSVIQLQKEIIDLFPQLKEKRGAFGYTMFYSKESKLTKTTLDQLERQGVVPILLLLGKVREN